MPSYGWLRNEVTPKILFTGSSGLLALNWALGIAGDFDVVLGLHEKKISVSGISTVSLNMENCEVFSLEVQNIRPDVVIHCAGLTSVEACEEDPELAHHINVDLSVNVAEACRNNNVQLVYISTDHLFSGDKPLVSEEEPPSPINIYGKTKFEAEKKILEVSADFLAIRTNFYGWGPTYRQSFSDMIIYKLRSGITVSLFNDFFYTPILIEELAQVVMELIAKKANGIFNVVGNERISKLDFGIRLAKYFRLDAGLIQTALFAQRKDLVKRPIDLSLSNKKVNAFLERNIGDIDKNIQRLYQQEQNGLAKVIRSV